MPFRKIINDPVYGFITIDDELIAAIIAHPYYQRLRRIHQMAMAHLVYPGAVHTRLHHSLGAYHLMSCALIELKGKGVEITKEEEQGAKIAILLHDIGHGPFSHALENILVENVHHEEISLRIMNELNKEFNGQLQTALDIFTDKHPKKYLHQLLSGQLDVDRMDYLTRDSFFTGVSEGVIGYDRILKMLVVHNGGLMIEEKGIYSIEKFLVARRLMYWQVYLHKTVLCAEQMLKQIIKRAKHINAETPGILSSFIHSSKHTATLEEFCNIDDHDVLATMKIWSMQSDKVLSTLCNGIINRQLLKVEYSSQPINKKRLQEKIEEVAKKLSISSEDAEWLVFTGEAISSTYNFEDENIHILFKDGTIKDISEVDNALINQNLKGKIKKYYICYLR
ncbi:HD domain-containing protein [Ferruginibacter albus]|uniref:HD domain-containing protein n=1 Tax=Ferruginibacter albus TaxID=2875540 RepID=UPI001CC42DBE|nr:HD domain-containing protein [Ferruginibacter albus]UAY52407.1 HD domain-containing protein [Ferruginibacter albus]